MIKQELVDQHPELYPLQQNLYRAFHAKNKLRSSVLINNVLNAVPTIQMDGDSVADSFFEAAKKYNLDERQIASLKDQNNLCDRGVFYLAAHTTGNRGWVNFDTDLLKNGIEETVAQHISPDYSHQKELSYLGPGYKIGAESYITPYDSYLFAACDICVVKDQIVNGKAKPKESLNYTKDNLLSDLDILEKNYSKIAETLYDFTINLAKVFKLNTEKLQLKNFFEADIPKVG